MPLIRTGTGSEVYTRVLAERLRERGHRVTLSEAGHTFQYAPWLAPIRPPDDADVILANSWNAAAFRGSAPLVTVVHHVVHDPALAEHKTLAQSFFHRWFVKPMELAAIRRSSLVVAVSEATHRAIRSYLADVPVRTIPNGVDVNFFAPGERGTVADTPAPIKLLFVGKPSRRKGFDTVARIVTQLADDCQFTCIGPQPERGLMVPPGEYLGRVTRERLRDAYRAADLLLMPSLLEGFGYAAAEAMACGVPVAACAGTAVADLIPEDGGIIRELDDIDGFVEEIYKLMGDPARRTAMQTRLRAHAVVKFDDRDWVDRIENGLQAVAQRTRPRRQS